MIVRWGLGKLPGLLSELKSESPLLVTSERWRELELPVAHAFYGVRPHSPRAMVAADAIAQTLASEHRNEHQSRKP